jgi:hypothetical protein
MTETIRRKKTDEAKRGISLLKGTRMDLVLLGIGSNPFSTGKRFSTIASPSFFVNSPLLESRRGINYDDKGMKTMPQEDGRVL